MHLARRQRLRISGFASSIASGVSTGRSLSCNVRIARGSASDERGSTARQWKKAHGAFGRLHAVPIQVIAAIPILSSSTEVLMPGVNVETSKRFYEKELPPIVCRCFSNNSEPSVLAKLVSATRGDFESSRYSPMIGDKEIGANLAALMSIRSKKRP